MGGVTRSRCAVCGGGIHLEAHIGPGGMGKAWVHDTLDIDRTHQASPPSELPPEMRAVAHQAEAYALQLDAVVTDLELNGLKSVACRSLAETWRDIAARIRRGERLT